MGGFTQIKLKDTSLENIERQNAILQIYGVPKKYRFSSLEKEQIIEYEYFVRGLGEFSENLFPKDKIKSLEDFKMYWNPRALGEVFVTHSGTLNFDCYFGRTSKSAMKKLGNYIADNYRELKEVHGSFSTFMERGMTKLQRQILQESELKKYI